MPYQVLRVSFAIELVIALAAAIAIWCQARKSHPNNGSRTLKATYFTTPSNNVIAIFGALVPILIGLLSYLYSKAPQENYSSLIASICLLFIVLILATWLTFAVLKKATETETILLKFPEDRRFITSIGLMSVFTPLGIFYFALFFIFEMPPPGEGNIFLLKHPRPNIGATRTEIESLLGQPSFSNSSFLEYDAYDSSVRLILDASGMLRKIDEIP